ncbi:UNVERIFIED_CONTAM: hypothetical protein Sradi_3316900 [Sesamum radiatum]|uniref:DUF4216 domain-containing protein n=1 Tax=Sesamum radiatum TaxID=300843 RepID=A0AAW2R1Q4_SESRA
MIADRSFLNELYKTYSPDDPLIDQLVTIDFVGWFKSRCRWVVPTRGTKVHPRYYLVDVNFKRMYLKDEPFILAQQAVQVYYTEYPSTRRGKVDWMVVCKTNARRLVDESHWTNVAYQEEEELPVPEVNTNNQTYDLHDPDGLHIFIDLPSAMQHGAGTSRTDEDDEYEDEEVSFSDYETDEESEERDNNSY